MKETILIQAKVQAIYYQTETDELGILDATKEGNQRITMAESEEILKDLNIPFKEVLKVKFEEVELEIPYTEYEKYAKKI